MVDRHREVWDSLGSYDPDWAVLSDPDRRFHGWDDDLEKFYASGRDEVADVLDHLPRIATGAALDWGAGTGRLSFALASHFEAVVAYDHSQSMLESLNQRAATLQVTNVQTTSDIVNLGVNRFDLVLSLLVLQHLPGRAAMVQAIRQMCRLAKPNAWIVVEIPDRARRLGALLQPRYRLYRLLRRGGFSAQTLHSRGLSGISMRTVDPRHVRSAFAESGATVVQIEPAPRHDAAYEYLRYYAQRSGDT